MFPIIIFRFWTIIQIVKDDITFRTSSGEVRTETLTDQIKLFSL